MSLKAVIAPKGTLEWKEALRAIGVVIRDETGELFDDKGRAILCKDCKTKMTLDNIGFVHADGIYCAPVCAILAMFEADVDGRGIDEDTRVLKMDIGELIDEDGRVLDVNGFISLFDVKVYDWFWEV